jgi:hypothetical protein
MTKKRIDPADINRANREYWADPNHQWEAALRSVVDDQKARAKKGPAAGGKATAEAKRVAANGWHAECVSKARALLTQGKSPRELAGILSEQFGRSARQVREVLKKAEVK